MLWILIVILVIAFIWAYRKALIFRDELEVSQRKSAMEVVSAEKTTRDSYEGQIARLKSTHESEKQGIEQRIAEAYTAHSKTKDELAVTTQTLAEKTAVLDELLTQIAQKTEEDEQKATEATFEIIAAGDEPEEVAVTEDASGIRIYPFADAPKNLKKLFKVKDFTQDYERHPEGLVEVGSDVFVTYPGIETVLNDGIGYLRKRLDGSIVFIF